MTRLKLIYISLLYFSCNAEVTIDYIMLDSTNSCNYANQSIPYKVGVTSYEKADEELINQLRVLYSAAGFMWDKNGNYVNVLKSQAVSNCRAYTALYDKNKPDLGYIRRIDYNPNFLHEVENKVGSYYGVLSILAHELAHHLYGHSFSYGDLKTEEELQADYFSGFMLAQIVDTILTISLATKSLSIFGDEIATSTHPQKNDRIKVFTDGWNYAKMLDSVSCEARSLLQTDPEKFMERIKIENPTFYFRLLDQMKHEQIEENMNELVALQKSNGIQDNYAFRLITDSNYYFMNERDSVATAYSPAFSQVNTKVLKLEMLSDHKQRNDISDYGIDIPKASVLYLDSKNVIWDKLPNGIPFIVGYKQKIK